MRHLAALYDAIEDDSALAVLAETVAAASNSRSANIHHFVPGGENHFLQMSYYKPEHADLYAAHFVHKDPWLRIAQREKLNGRTVSMDRYISPEEFVRTAYYNDLFRSLGDDTGRCMGSLTKVGRSLLVTAVHRPLGGAAYTPAEETALDEILGHVRRVLHLRRLLTHERTEARRLEHMVEATRAAMLVVDKRLRIVRSSAAAHRILSVRDGLCTRGTELAVADFNLAQSLRRAVEAVVDRAPASRTGFLCGRPSGRAGYRLLVLPAGARGEDGALILIDDPTISHDGADAIEWVAQAYGLTPAERALASGIAEGLTLAEIAGRRGIARETVRAQLRALFAKTGVNRQAELVRLLSPMRR